MRASLVVNRRCGFRSARISNALINAANLDALSRKSELIQNQMLLRNRVRHTV